MPVALIQMSLATVMNRNFNSTRCFPRFSAQYELLEILGR